MLTFGNTGDILDFYTKVQNSVSFSLRTVLIDLNFPITFAFSSILASKQNLKLTKNTINISLYFVMPTYKMIFVSTVFNQIINLKKV